MASFFGEIVEPSTRALFEDCSDEESNEKLNLEIVWKTGYENVVPTLNALLVVDGVLTLAFAEGFLLGSSHTVVGNVLTRGDGEQSKSSAKGTTPSPLILQGDHLICFVQPSLPSIAAFDFADLIAPLVQQAKEVVILTSLSTNSYKSLPGASVPANAVYSIATSSFKGVPLRPLPAEANILTSVPAAVASWCEINNIPAVVYICYSDSEVLDSLTAQPLLGIVPQRQQSVDLKRRWVYGGAGRRIGSLSNMYM